MYDNQMIISSYFESKDHYRRREYQLGCVSWGSLPPAKILWYRMQSSNSKGIIPMNINPEDTETSVSKDNNITES